MTGINVEDMLAAAEADTPETRHLKQAEKSLDQAASIASTGFEARYWHPASH